MAYDRSLAARIRTQLQSEPGISEKKMFGGLAFLSFGHMAIAVGSKGDIMIRINPAETAELLALPGARPTEMRGRIMTGWLDVDAEGVRTDEALHAWIERALSTVRAMPPKE